MVKRLLLALSLSACSVDGVVLVLPEPPMDAGVEEQDAQLDAVIALDSQPLLDARESSVVEAAAPVGGCRVGGASDGFYDSFPDGPLDARWLIADGTTSLGTFARGNVSVASSTLWLTSTSQAGAAIATRDLFASATYQVQLRVPAGVELAVWWRRDDEADGTIDITTPGQGDFTRVRMRTRDARGSSENQFMLGAPLNDGSDHILRFDRYNTNSPSVRFWVDDVSRWVTSASLPTNRAGRLWIVATGEGVVRITNAFITPFGNAGDACTDGELRGPGLIP
ncbi:MAG: hypothetical protein ABW352_25895 [Polyangiales bacterium]